MSDATIHMIKEIMEVNHEEYCGSVTPYYMAASLEVCCYIVDLLYKRKAKTLLDMGSGFSTYTMYLYKMLMADNDIEIWSVETDDVFRKKTISFINENSLSFVSDEARFLMWENVDDLFGMKYDFVFCDIGGTKERKSKFPKVVSLDVLGENSAVLFDDCNKVRPMPEWFKGYTFKMKELKKETMDRIHRWSTLVYDIEKIKNDI